MKYFVEDFKFEKVSIGIWKIDQIWSIRLVEIWNSKKKIKKNVGFGFSLTVNAKLFKLAWTILSPVWHVICSLNWLTSFVLKYIWTLWWNTFSSENSYTVLIKEFDCTLIISIDFALNTNYISNFILLICDWLDSNDHPVIEIEITWVLHGLWVIQFIMTIMIIESRIKHIHFIVSKDHVEYN